MSSAPRSWAEPEGEYGVASHQGAGQRQVGASDIHHRPDRAFREGPEARIAQAGDILTGDVGPPRGAGGIGGDGQQDALLVEIQRARILGPTGPDMLPDRSALGGRQGGGVVAQRIAAAVGLTA